MGSTRGVNLIRRTLVNKRSDRAPATINSKTTIIINELANADHQVGVLLCGPGPGLLTARTARCSRRQVAKGGARRRFPGAVASHILVSG